MSIGLRIVLITASVVSWMPPDGRAQIDEPVIDISANESGLRIQASSANRMDVLRALSVEVGVSMVVHGRLPGERTQWSISAESTDMLVRGLLRDVSVIVVADFRKGESFGPSGIRIYVLDGSWGSNEPVILDGGHLVDTSLRSAVWSKAIATTSVKQRVDEIERLRGLEDELALERIGFALQHDPSRRVRSLAVRLFAEAPEESAIRGLTLGLGDADSGIRSQVARAFGAIQSEEAVMLLGQLSQGDPDPGVRKEALAVLETVGSELAHVFIVDGKQEP